uniref:Uncharacterized protein n=1 Tax=Anguilla anguilla TaxID=7936 RepID=A0A0E9RD22_ANGAN
MHLGPVHHVIRLGPAQHLSTAGRQLDNSSELTGEGLICLVSMLLEVIHCKCKHHKLIGCWM